MAINVNQIMQAPLTPCGEWIMDPTNDYMLPLKHPETGEYLWAVMEDAPGVEAHGCPVPEGMVVCKVPPQGLPVFPEENAPPGGTWVEEAYCGPTSMACLTFPCCWCIFCSLNPKCTGIDSQAIYYAPDGKRYTEWGRVLGTYNPEQLQIKIKSAAAMGIAERDDEEEAEVQAMMDAQPQQESAQGVGEAAASAPPADNTAA